ncbi:MAG: SDR family NAD(P)-dependent oxidoreductase [Pseudorhodobacter sp.]
MYLEKYRLDGRRALVTGGGGGIGLATATALAEAGAAIIIADVREEHLIKARDALAAKGWTVETIVLDVSDPEAVARAAETVGPVDILIANAGITFPDTPGEAIPDADWRRLMEVNLDGVYWCCREFGRAMLENGQGTIVTLGSISGSIANKPQRQAHYNAAKAAVHHLTKSLGAEWAERGVRVNCVAPTYVDTPMSNSSFDDPERMPIWMDFTPMRRVARPDEIASAILFLASDASSAMTGTTMLVDCGYTAW